MYKIEIYDHGDTVVCTISGHVSLTGQIIDQLIDQRVSFKITFIEDK